MTLILGERIKKARKKANLTQQELAKRINISYPTLNRYERGHVIPGADILAKIAKELACDPGQLLTGENDSYIIGIKRPAEGLKKKKIVQVSGPVIEYGYEPSHEDLLAKAEAVLSTRTIYRIALASNIEAFYEAIGFREDNRRQKAKIEGLETRLAAMEEKLSRVTIPGAAAGGEEK